LHSLFRDEEVVLVDVDLDTRLASIEVLERLSAVLEARKGEVELFVAKKEAKRLTAMALGSPFR